jgi:hypothetical protein
MWRIDSVSVAAEEERLGAADKAKAAAEEKRRRGLPPNRPRPPQTGESPRLFGIEPPKPRLEAVHVVDMSSSNSWAEFAATYRRTRTAYEEHEAAKSDLKKLVPEDAKEVVGHGLRAKRSKSGAISFELADAPLQ